MLSSISFYIVCLIGFQLGRPHTNGLEVKSDDLPNFKKLTECESAALCIRVTFANGDEDMITANEFHGERHAKHDVFKGQLVSTNAKVVIILQDESHQKDLVVFKSNKAPSCHNFRVDLEGSGDAVCSVAPPNPDKPEDDLLVPTEEDPEDDLSNNDDGMVDRSNERDSKKWDGKWDGCGKKPTKRCRAWSSNRKRCLIWINEKPATTELMKLDPLGYRIRLAVYYDNLWKDKFREEADTHADAVMALADEMFSEETLQTQLHFEVLSVNHVNETWSVFGFQSNQQYKIALENSMKFDGPDLNVFLTGGDGNGGGKAFLGTICKKSPTNKRSSIAGWAGEDEYTAEIVAHEIGHNLGMWHDFTKGLGDKNCSTGFRQVKAGVDCRGYMDYDGSIGWSACNVKDFTKHFNKYKTAFCLPQKNLGKGCLAECNNESGLCEDFCGTNNYCCKKGVAENGCDGKVGGKDHHVCVQEPLGDSCLASNGEKCLFPITPPYPYEKAGNYSFCPEHGKTGKRWCHTRKVKKGSFAYCMKGACWNREPYCTEQDDCRAAFEDLGYKAGGLGYEYVGNYDVKGCYGYKTGEFAGHFFYGTGGTEDLKWTNLDLPKIRVMC